MRRVSQRFVLVATAVMALQVSPVIGQKPPDPAPGGLWQALPPEYRERAERRERVLGLLASVFRENPELRDRLEALQGAYLETMQALDPETARRRARMSELEDAYTRAVVADDAGGVRAMVREGLALRSALETTLAEATGRPDLEQRLEAFRAEVLAALTKLDPDASSLMEWEEVLDAVLAEGVLRLR